MSIFETLAESKIKEAMGKQEGEREQKSKKARRRIIAKEFKKGATILGIFWQESQTCLIIFTLIN